MRPRLLAVGVVVRGTGLGRVLDSLTRHLAERWDIHVVGVGFHGAETACESYRLYPAPLGGDVFGAAAVQRLAAVLRPECAFVYHDLWHMERYARALTQARAAGTRLLAYLPLDGAIGDAELVRPMRGFDRLLVFTEWARGELVAAAASLEGELPPVGVVPHGVDTDVFFPRPELAASGLSSAGRAAARRQVFSGWDGDSGSFVVLNASRPSARKRVDLTLEGFARFAADKPPAVRLCLHQAISSADDRAAIAAADARWGLGDRLVVDPLGSRVLDDAELNLLYNACDVGLNTSMGEGWGLTSCEHAAAGAAQVLPRHSAGAEIWPGAAELLEPQPVERQPFSPLLLAPVTAAAVAAALERLYRQPAERSALARRGLERMREPRFRWSAVAAGLESELNTARTPPSSSGLEVPSLLGSC